MNQQKNEQIYDFKAEDIQRKAASENAYKQVHHMHEIVPESTQPEGKSRLIHVHMHPFIGDESPPIISDTSNDVWSNSEPAVQETFNKANPSNDTLIPPQYGAASSVASSVVSPFSSTTQEDSNDES